MSHWIPIKIVDLALDAKDNEIAALKEENARLKAELERLTDAITSGNAITPDAKPEQSAEIAFLKAEVERLKNNVAYLDTKLDEELDK